MALGAWPLPAAAEADARADSLRAMRTLDERVAAVGHRLAVASLGLCAEPQWLPGFAVHDLSQYGAAWREAAIRAFGLGDAPAVLALAPAGPAERAGLRRDDIILRIDGAPPPPMDGAGRSFERTERILDLIDNAFADGRARIEVQRGGEVIGIEIAAERGCASRFQLVPSRRLNAFADGRYVQVTTAMAGYAADEDELAGILAHEFAHNLLRHRVRLGEAGVARGLLGSIGRDARLVREMEIEADRLSIHLLDRAGFDPRGPVRFWSRFGRHGLNFLSAPTHPNWRRRIELFEAEIAALRAARAQPHASEPSG